MHRTGRSSVPKIVQNTIYEISNNQENYFNENSSMRAIVKILRAQTSEHYLNFASKSSKGLILRALQNFKGPFDTTNNTFRQKLPCNEAQTMW